jgi:hypothetical protein
MGFETRVHGIAVEVVRRTADGRTRVYQQVVEVLREGRAIPYMEQLVVEVLRERSDAFIGGAVVFVVSV